MGLGTPEAANIMLSKSVENPLWRLALLFVDAFLFCLSTATGLAFAGSVNFSANGMQFNASVESLQAKKFSNVLQQHFDYSCGSASLATLLKFHYQQDVEAMDVFRSMYSAGDSDLINRWGFSLLDMKKFLLSKGYQAEGIKVTLEQFVAIASVPAIVMIQVDGYKHFVVLKGIRDGSVLLGDPARGLRQLSIGEFQAIWSGMFFIITSHANVGRAAFNRQADWKMLVHAPLKEAIARPALDQFYLSFPYSSDFY